MCEKRAEAARYVCVFVPVSPASYATWQAGAICVQDESVYTWLPPSRQSEDCLYLDVYQPLDAPTLATKPRPVLKPVLKPVLVFFYGGSYVEGDDKFALYDATELVGTAAARAKDVIVVVGACLASSRACTCAGNPSHSQTA